MKKLILALFFAVMAVSVNAQTTWNMRVGGGSGRLSLKYDGEYYHYTYFEPALQLQCNIPFRVNSHWTFSPSVLISSDFDEHMPVCVPLTLGYKVLMGNGNIFFPKVGIATGIEAMGLDPIIGPTFALDFELKHFVIGVNAFTSVYDADTPNTGVLITFGYKF